MRIVFMGTPEFAVPCLEALLKTEDTLVGIVTQPDRPKGRGQQLAPSPVKVIAQRQHLPLLQPTKMKDASFIAELSAWKPDLIAVAAFGRHSVSSAARMYQRSRLTPAEVSGSGPDSMGDHQRRD